MDIKYKKLFKGKRVLITGGAGFIGSSIAAALVDSVEGVKITILDAMLPLYGGNRFNLKDIENKIVFIKGDIRDKETVVKAVKDQDFIFNLAAQVSYIDSKDQPFLDLDINCIGHLNVLEAAVAVAPKSRIIFSSSRMVYGKILTTPVSESHPTDPLSIYGIHKLTAEKYYRYYHDIFGLDTIVVRIPNPYGPRQHMKHNKYSIVGWFIRQALNGETIKIFGDGSQQRDYLYIDDLVSAFLALASAGRAGEVYNIGNKERITMAEMIDSVLREVGTGIKENIAWPENYKKNETGSYVADTSKIEKDTSWSAKISLNVGIHKTVEYYKKYKKYYW